VCDRGLGFLGGMPCPGMESRVLKRRSRGLWLGCGRGGRRGSVCPGCILCSFWDEEGVY